MADREFQRRLSAVIAADVVGYTRLMEADTDGTVGAWHDAREDVIKPCVADHSGNIVKLTGDGFLVEFPTVQDAVNCAITMQKGLAPSSLDFRMGINLGDIVDDGEDIHGEGVNVAARLEGLAEPGGIVISGGVYDQVKNRINADYEDIGPQEVKNVTDPVQAYRVTIEAVSVSTSRIAAATDKPSIAVLPFDNLSGDPEQEYFSDGITEDIITGLSRIRQFFVIARNTTFTFKGQAVDVQAIASELGVRYVLEGSVRKAANRVRITAQLIDGESGNHIWADRYDRELEDIFEVQDEITQTVVGALGPELSRAEQERARLKAPDNLGAWDLCQRGLWCMWRYDKDDIAEARRQFQQATDLDPKLSLAYAAHAYTHLQDMFQGFNDDRTAALDNAMQLANQALGIDDRESFAYLIRAIINLFRRDHSAARNDIKSALEINSSDAMAHMVLGLSYIWCNELEGALKYLDDAERLSPKDPALWLSLIGRTLNCLIEERFEDADAAGKRAIAVPNAPLIARFIHAACLGHLGRTVEAQDAIETLISLNPKFSIKNVDRILPTNERHVRAVILEGLQKAGAPEG